MKVAIWIVLFLAITIKPTIYNYYHRQIMKHILIIFVMFLLVLASSAHPHDCIIVHMKGGSYAVFPIDKNPRITFEGKVVSISDERWQISNVQKYTIGDSEETGIIEMKGSKNLKGYSLKDGQVIVRLADKAKQVRLYTLGGMEVPIKDKPDANGYLRLKFPSGGDGVFILNIDGETLKIRRP